MESYLEQIKIEQRKTLDFACAKASQVVGLLVIIHEIMKRLFFGGTMDPGDAPKKLPGPYWPG